MRILHTGLQHYVNQELPDVQTGFRKGKGTRDQVANIHWITPREFQKNIYLFHRLHYNLWLCQSWKTVESCQRDGNIRPSYLSPEKPTCRSRSNSQNPVWNNWLVQDWERSMTGLSAVTLFNLYTEHIMRNARIKIGGRNINNLRYADTIVMAESEEELKSLLMRMKEEKELA